ncbi:hypothetical protein [Methylibium sp.]|jgi:hypothetical protein|uniref:hypothetical protein n=1 Tax=Methylibium sp. TaxID=2067992 RepID=UPI00333E6F3D
MKATFDLSPRWSTAWSGADIVVRRNSSEVDRLHTPDIRRIVFVQAADAQGAADPSFALVELDAEFVVFPTETGFAGRVHFERQAFWAAKACTYWTNTVTARLPAHCLRRRGFLLAQRGPRFGRVPRADLDALVDQWLIEGPCSWDERRWQRFERSVPFAHIDTRRDTTPSRLQEPQQR